MRGRRDPQPSLFYAIDVEARIRPARADVGAGRGWLTGNVESVVFAGRGAVFGDPTERVDVQGSEVVDPAAAVGVIPGDGAGREPESARSIVESASAPGAVDGRVAAMVKGCCRRAGWIALHTPPTSPAMHFQAVGQLSGFRSESGLIPILTW